MDHTPQNSSDGGGGRLSRTWPPADAPRDRGGPEARDPPPGPDATDARPPRAPLVLSLDRIKVAASSNEYTDGPAAPRGGSPPAERRRPRSSPASSAPSREAAEERPNSLRDLPSPPRLGDTNSDGVGGVAGGASPGQRLLGEARAIRTQPNRAELGPDELKPLSAGPAPWGGVTKVAHPDHKDRCCCGECRRRRARALPSCWMCGKRCMCSAHKAAEYATCVCCVRGLFYHCSSDDEDTCSDKPFACEPPRCCARWAAVSLLALLFPCLLCYLPARGCVAACECCYDCCC